MCGIIGVSGHVEASTITYLGLHALQHRGQESAGMVSSDGQQLHASRHLGLVGEVFRPDELSRLPGRSAIGHVRYSTAGGSAARNAQPLVLDCQHGALAVAHNGNLTNALALRRHLETEGAIFQSTADTEVIVHLIARSHEPDMVENIAAALRQVRGAYSLLFLTPTQMIAVRDPMGFRPLCLGRLRDAYVFASESCAFDLIEAERIRELEPGEMVVVERAGGRSGGRSGERAGLRSLRLLGPAEPHFCIFEHVYFARPDSVIDGRGVYRVRLALGRRLAAEAQVDADVVIPVPDSGMAAAIGYAAASHIPYQMGLIRSHYVGRTFIEPAQSIRHFGVKLKLSAVREVVAGQRVVVIDDSIVRGTTCRKIVTMLRAAGAREVHLRISSPPTTHSCFYGTDTPTRAELIASAHSVDEIARYITCDSLAYLSLGGMKAAVREAGMAAEAGTAVGEAETAAEAETEMVAERGTAAGDCSPTGYCDACFSGNYPLELGSEMPGPARSDVVGGGLARVHRIRDA